MRARIKPARAGKPNPTRRPLVRIDTPPGWTKAGWRRISLVYDDTFQRWAALLRYWDRLVKKALANHDKMRQV